MRTTDFDRGAPVLAAAVALRAGDRTLPPASPSSPNADSTGLHRFDAVPAGDYVLWARRVGYRTLKEAVEVRLGHTDTLHVRWRVQPICVVQ